MTEQEEGLGFSAAHDQPVPYMQRLRDYYLALGYGNPYRWASYTEVPFTPLAKPLADSRLALITTAAPYQPDKGDQGPGAAYNAAAKFYRVYSDGTDGEPDLRISHLGYDRKYTTAEDINSYLPLAQMKRLATEGRIGEVVPRFHGAPTNRSQRATLDNDCPELLARVRADRADAAVIVAN
jgi:hypothetical protein